MADSNLETLLRSHPITDGVIQLSVMKGQWMCTVAHRPGGHQTHMLGRFSDDPVEAMRVTLIADEQHDREVRRKYSQAAKVGVVAAVDEMEALLGGDPVADPVADDFMDML